MPKNRCNASNPKFSDKSQTEYRSEFTSKKDLALRLDPFYFQLFTSSLEILKSSPAPDIQSMMKLFAAKYGNQIPIFRVTGSFQEQDATPFPAGFHRATGSICLDFAKINPDDWMITFTHETLHALDDQIFKGVEGYAEPGKAEGFAKFAFQYTNFSQLPPADQASLEAWLTFGMDRGLLAEYRAWSATFQIYEEGLSDHLWSKREWLEKILADKKSGESLEGFTYRYLDAHSADPVDGIFARPLIESALQSLRQKFEIKSPSLYGLAEITAN